MDGTVQNDEGPGGYAGTSHLLVLLWHPQRDSNPCRHLERAQTGLHRGRWSHDALLTRLPFVPSHAERTEFR